MPTEIQSVELRDSLSDLGRAAEEATKAFAVFSLVYYGIKIDAEDIDILNAEVIE